MSHRFIFRPVHHVKKPLRNANAGSMSNSPQIRGIILDLLDQREAKGMETYGMSLDDNNDERDWTIELIEELLDALFYASKEILELRRQLKTPFD